MSTFLLPDVGEGLREAEIVAWHVGVGDHVVADQPLVSVETDKAVVEIPSPQSGHIAALHGEPGDVIDVGEPLVDFADGVAPDVGAIVGDLPGNADAAPAGSEPPPVDHGDRPAHATPLVRRMARRLGVDLDTVPPSGPRGSVTRADVEAAAARAHASAPGRPVTDGTVEPLRGVRRAMDANMSRAHAEVVPASVTDDADITDWLPGTDTTVRLVRAVARACEAEPALNAAHLGRDVGLRHHDRVDLGIAVDTPDGLFVPVLRDAARRDAADLRDGLDALRSDAQARSIAPDHLKGATITLSNFGVFGGRHAALVVVPPQVAIVGAGRARDVVSPHAGGIHVRRHLPISLTFDHRVVMGGEATRFLVALIDDLEAPT